MTTDETPPTDPVWTASRYLLDDLSEAETEAFEQILAVDQDAREALVQAVTLHAAVRVAASSPVRHRVVRPTLIALITTLAACLLSAIMSKPHQPTPDRKTDGELALAWDHYRGTADLEFETAPTLSDDLEESLSAPDDLIDPDSSWMYEAMVQTEPSDGSPAIDDPAAGHSR